jgi:Ca-activated chloride channel homolog
MQMMEVKIDEEALTQIAQMTGGKYFRATDNTKLKEIYTEIDTLEKTRIDVQEYSKRSEEFLPFAILAACCFYCCLANWYCAKPF